MLSGLIVSATSTVSPALRFEASHWPEVLAATRSCVPTARAGSDVTAVATLSTVRLVPFALVWPVTTVEAGMLVAPRSEVTRVMPSPERVSVVFTEANAWVAVPSVTVPAYAWVPITNEPSGRTPRSAGQLGLGLFTSRPSRMTMPSGEPLP